MIWMYRIFEGVSTSTQPNDSYNVRETFLLQQRYKDKFLDSNQSPRCIVVWFILIIVQLPFASLFMFYCMRHNIHIRYRFRWPNWSLYCGHSSNYTVAFYIWVKFFWKGWGRRKNMYIENFIMNLPPIHDKVRVTSNPYQSIITQEDFRQNL